MATIKINLHTSFLGFSFLIYSQSSDHSFEENIQNKRKKENRMKPVQTVQRQSPEGDCQHRKREQGLRSGRSMRGEFREDGGKYKR